MSPITGLLPGRPTESLRPRLRRDRHDPAGRTSQIHRNPRTTAVDVRREALGQLRGVIVTAPDRLREELRVLPTGRLLERCSRLRRSSTAGADELATRLVLRSLARRIAAA